MARSPITLQQLVYFLAAVEHGSLSAAAEAHFIAQPSLSEQIRRLERALGVTLFTRTNRKLLLTEAARMLVPYAERAIAAADEAVTAVDPVRNMTGGSVSFGTFSVAHDLINADLITEFRGLYPGISVRIEELNSVQIANAVRAGDVEAGVVALPVDDRGLEISPVIWRSEACYYTNCSDRVATPISIEKVAAACLILPEARWGDMDPTRLQLNARAQGVGVVIRPQIEVESCAVALELARRGANPHGHRPARGAGRRHAQPDGAAVPLPRTQLRTAAAAPRCGSGSGTAPAGLLSGRRGRAFSGGSADCRGSAALRPDRSRSGAGGVRRVLRAGLAECRGGA